MPSALVEGFFEILLCLAGAKRDTSLAYPAIFAGIGFAAILTPKLLTY